MPWLSILCVLSSCAGVPVTTPFLGNARRIPLPAFCRSAAFETSKVVPGVVPIHLCPPIAITPSPSLHHHHSIALIPSLRHQHSFTPSALPSFYPSAAFNTSRVVPGVGKQEEEKYQISFWRVCTCWGTHLHHVNSFSSGIGWNKLPGPLFIGVCGDCGPCPPSKTTNRPSKERRLSWTIGWETQIVMSGTSSSRLEMSLRLVY